MNKGEQPQRTKPLPAIYLAVLGAALALVLLGVYFYALPKAREIARQKEAEQIEEAQEVEERFGAAFSGSDAGTGEFTITSEHPRSRFDLQVAPLSQVRVMRFLDRGQMPSRNVARIEEMVNFFSYNYSEPRGGESFSITLNAMPCPWNPTNLLIRAGVRARKWSNENRRGKKLLFLVDTSRSMASETKIALLQTGLRKWVDALQEKDAVAIVALGQESDVILDWTTGKDKRAIQDAIERIQADKGSPKAEGIELAYNLAASNTTGRAKIILCTDGSLDVEFIQGKSLIRFAKERAEAGITLSAFGLGMGQYQNVQLERLAEAGGGNHEYINSSEVAYMALHQELEGETPIVARHVRVQVDFNEESAAAYKLIGYEEVGESDSRLETLEVLSGHEITALYEVIPAAGGSNKPLLSLKLFYTEPHTGEQKDMQSELRLKDAVPEDPGLKFAASVAWFGLCLKEPRAFPFEDLLELAEQGQDGSVLRRNFLELIARAGEIQSTKGAGIKSP